MPTYRAPCPTDAAHLLDAMHDEICDQHDGDDQVAERMHAKAVEHADLLDKILAAAWSTFVEHAGLTEEREDPRDAEIARIAAERDELRAEVERLKARPTNISVNWRGRYERLVEHLRAISAGDLDEQEKLAAMEERISACDPTDPPPAAPSGEVSDEEMAEVFHGGRRAEFKRQHPRAAGYHQTLAEETAATRDETIAGIRAVRAALAKAPTGAVSDEDLRAAFDNAERSAYTAAAQEGATARVAISLGVDAGIRAVRRVLERATVREAKADVTARAAAMREGFRIARVHLITDHGIGSNGSRWITRDWQQAETALDAAIASLGKGEGKATGACVFCGAPDAKGHRSSLRPVGGAWCGKCPADGPPPLTDHQVAAVVQRAEAPRSPAREDVALTVGAALAARPYIEFHDGVVWRQLETRNEGRVWHRGDWHPAYYAGAGELHAHRPARLVPLADADAPPESRGPIGGAS